MHFNDIFSMILLTYMLWNQNVSMYTISEQFL